MSYDLILSNIGKYVVLTEMEVTFFTSKLELMEVKKKDFVLHQNERCKHIYFLNNGTLRAFHLSTEGKESTVMFAIADWWITDMHAFTNNASSIMNIMAVEDSQLLALSYVNLERIWSQLPKFEKFFRILLQKAYVREQLRSIQNLSLSAPERYDRFISKYPEIVKKVTKKQIASYLGVTPEFLCTIRAKNVDT